MKIALLGTRGVPNMYGGYEQFAEFISSRLIERGHEVVIYNPHYHPFNESSFHGAEIRKKKNSEKSYGTIGNFQFDYLCLRDAFITKIELVVVLGYTTASVFYPFLNRNNSILLTNMDGLEWKRSKWNKTVQRLAKWFEKLAAKNSDVLIADNPEIKNYLKKTYAKDSFYIPYGCEEFTNPDESTLAEFDVIKNHYNLMVARMESENNIETIIQGHVNQTETLLVIGGYQNKYGQQLFSKYSAHKNIRFLGGIYDLNKLHNLRYFSKFYFHGHSVGGTNPSLLEAMASQAFIIANDNEFNRSILGSDAAYFVSPNDISKHLEQQKILLAKRDEFVQNNLIKIRTEFNWERIADQYESMFREVLDRRLT